MESFVNNSLIKKEKLLKSMDLYPFFRPIEASDCTTVTVKGRRQTMIGSNNYLGLTNHPYVMEAAAKAIEKYGTACTGSRFLNGNFSIHEEFEEKLADFIGDEAALVFAMGTLVNLGSLPAINGPRDCLILDSENHASIIDGARLSFGASYKFKHNDMDSLKKVLEDNRARYKRATIVADGVFSMSGDIVNLPELVRLAKKYDCLVYIDDAHGFGVMGNLGRGTASHFGLANEVDFQMATFSKAFASTGGFISGKKDAINYIKLAARSFMFSAALTPSCVATASACLDLIQKDGSIIDKLWANVALVRDGFKKIGFYTYDSQTPIIPILIGNDIKAIQVTNFLHQNDIFATPVLAPAVPQGESLIRTSYMSSHTPEILNHVIDVFARAQKKFDIPIMNQH